LIPNFSIATILELELIDLIPSRFPNLKTPRKCLKSNLPVMFVLGLMALIQGVFDGD